MNIMQSPNTGMGRRGAGPKIMTRWIEKGKKKYILKFDDEGCLDTVVRKDAPGKLLSTKNRDVQFFVNNQESLLWGPLPKSCNYFKK